MGEDLQKRIFEKERKIEDLRERSDEIYKQIIKDAASCLKSWYNECVKECMKSDPDELERKSVEQLRKLMDQISAFTDKFEERISKSLETGERPWHKRPDDDDISTVEEVMEKKIQQACIQVTQDAMSKQYYVDHDPFVFVRHNTPRPSCEALESISNYKALYQQAKPELEILKELKMQEAEEKREEQYQRLKSKLDQAGK